jgi:hypothetical protein
MSKKPYIYEDAEGWLQIAKRKDWNDPKENPMDLLPYSELQRPYGEGKNRGYPEWEWSFPDDDMPPIDDVTYPDPVGKCNVRDNCMGVGIIGPHELDCGDCYTYTHVHVIESCQLQWWMAYGNWYIKGDPGFASQLFEGPIMTTVCAADDAEGVITLVYEGPLECKDQIDITISCGQCCEEGEGFSLTGGDTVVSGEVWTGTISPPCPSLECSVVSNSGCDIGCTLNAFGSQVVVATDPDDCGSFTVTVSQPSKGECAGVSASKTVRTSEGQWNNCNNLTFGGLHICYGTPWEGGQYAAIVSCGTGGWGYINARDCDGNIIHQFQYERDCCPDCGSCTAQSHTRGYASQIWSCTC